PVCSARYKTKYGVLCEINLGGQLYYCLATFPDTEHQDAKWMMIEERFGQCQTAQELLNTIPTVRPLTEGEVLKPVPGQEGVWKFTAGTFKGIDILEWDQLFNFVKAEAKLPTK
ncbi:MAG: hypothetical protein GY888_02220, partial [Planctomycetaceae bacterium]|nr:hypothetical protein [Planctomycetaceae bacterium]